ncbi:AAA family ATPase [Anaeromyxobacter oryzisoli]|uniref:AAA family ATPase n=1 Tax=Anaeromyxobacter oryzisoli TaxID=2925408 RepID=UPI001F5A1E49|nr:AAA family ATPase [Anaeromyxobacter sp. SG63]
MNVSAEIAELWSAGTPIVYVVTPEEDRAVAACEAAAAAFDARVGVWSSQRGLDPQAPSAKDPLALLDALARAPAPFLAVALDLHLALEAPAVARRLRDLVPRLAAEGRCLAIVAPRVAIPDGLHGDVAVIRLPLPDDAELAALLEVVQTGLAHPARPAPLSAVVRHRALVAARGLTETQARRAFTRALRRDPALGPDAIGAIAAEKKRLLASDLGLELVDAPERPEDLGGLASFKAWMEERALAFDPDASRYGLPPPRGVLLVGVQGCGKSLAAKAAAARLAVPILRLDLPRVLGARAGAEEGLARALEAAEALAPVALWVDEIEKGFAGSAPSEGGDPRAARVLGAFSTWLQERRGPVFVVATANDVSRLPPELLRRGRFDELFFVDLPDLEARREILALHLRRRGRDPGAVDVPSIAELCLDYSGAELEQVVVGALHRAYAQRRELDTADLRRVAQDVVPLFKTYEEQIKALREWARGRARVAGRPGAVVDLFRRVQQG